MPPLIDYLTVVISEQDQATQGISMSKRSLFQMSFTNQSWNSQYVVSGLVQLGQVVGFQPINFVYIKNIGLVPIGITAILAYAAGSAPANNPIALIAPGGVFVQWNPTTAAVAPGTPSIPADAIGGYNTIDVVNTSAQTGLIEYFFGG